MWVWPFCWHITLLGMSCNIGCGWPEDNSMLPRPIKPNPQDSVIYISILG